MFLCDDEDEKVKGKDERGKPTTKLIKKHVKKI